MTSPTWTPEQVVSKETAQNLIESQFPYLDAAPLRFVGVGWDNTVFSLNDEWVFRFPRREIAVTLLKHERMILPKIAERLPLSIPVPQLNGCPGHGYSWRWAGYPWIPGRSACQIELDDGSRSLVAKSLALFLRELHAVPVDLASAAGVPGDNHGRLDFSAKRPMLEENLNILFRKGLINSVGDFDEVAASGYPREVEKLCLVHGDLYIRHLLIDEDHQLIGVIDWGDVHIGDPALDLSILYTLLPPAARADFQTIYGVIDSDTLRLARYRALLHAVNQVLYGEDVNDASLKRAGEGALNLILRN